MLRRILVPLDGSPRAEQALPIAARLAQGSGGSLVLCRVVGRPSALALYGARVPTPETAPLLEQAEKYLSSVAGREALSDLHVETVVIDGLVADEILAAISRRSIDLVVMCSHGHTEPTRWLLGSVAEKVTRLSEAPVLVLRDRGVAMLEQAAEHSNSAHPLRVLVPLDGSPLAEAALQPTAGLVEALVPQGGSAIHLMSVLPPDDVEQGDVSTQEHGRFVAREEVIGQLNAYLARAAERVKQTVPRPHWPVMSWSVACNADVAATILRMTGQRVDDTNENGEPEAKVAAYHLIAMTTHGSGGKRPWSIGTVADRVLYATELPLLLIRP